VQVLHRSRWPLLPALLLQELPLGPMSCVVHTEQKTQTQHGVVMLCISFRCYLLLIV
jgi:hypothetical protein